MAVCRGGVSFWVGCVRSHGSRQPITKQSWNLCPALDWQLNGASRALCSASWALAPPNSLRYQTVKQPSLSHPFHHVCQLNRAPSLDVEWEETYSLCVLLQPGESEELHTLVEVPSLGQAKLRELLASGPYRPIDFLFPLTTVDGRREDDISITRKAGGEEKMDAETREMGSFRSLFEAEHCPAPFKLGSRFYCFHCPGLEPQLGEGGQSGLRKGLEPQPSGLPLPPPISYYSHSEPNRLERSRSQRDMENEEKLAMVHEKLRTELPSFFMKGHDYSLYSSDVEFINGLLNTKTRGRILYQLTVSLWRLLCMCYYAETQMEVLKLTKHPEDGSIKARWRVKGLPLHTLMYRFYRKEKSHLYRTYDAFSTFYVGSDGLIHCHKVEKVMPKRPPVLSRVTSVVAGTLVALGVQEHRPALNLLPLLLSSLRQGRE